MTMTMTLTTSTSTITATFRYYDESNTRVDNSATGRSFVIANTEASDLAASMIRAGWTQA